MTRGVTDAKARRRDADARMPLSAHLKEFRTRLILAAVGMVVFAIAGWFLFDPVFDALRVPVEARAQEAGGLVTINFAAVVSALDLRIKMSLLIGVVLSSPWWLYQLWAFIAPGLNKREKRYTYGFLGAAIPLFLAGVALAWWIYPRAIEILTDFVPEGGSSVLDAQMFLSFAMRLVIAFGIGFVMPVIMVALTWAGLVTARTWAKGWRWAIMVILLASAILTPTQDVTTMMFMAAPLCVLYAAAVGIGLLRERFVRKRRPQDLDDLGEPEDNNPADDRNDGTGR